MLVIQRYSDSVPERTQRMAVTAVNRPSPPISLPPSSCLCDLHNVTLVKEVNAQAVANN